MSVADRQSPGAPEGPGIDTADSGTGGDRQANPYRDAYTTLAENSIAVYAMGLLIALIVLLVAILVGGQFAASVPSDNPFSSAMSTTIDTAGTAFEIFGVTLIILPGVAAVALILKGLGGVAGMGGGR